MIPAPLIAFVQGLGIGAGLIIAIGAQNAFVLRQGLRGHRVLLVALTCAFCDAVLIALGAGGFASLVRSFPALVPVATWAGAAFLLAYGALAFRAALRPRSLNADEVREEPPRAARVLFMAIGFSWLNPHAWLDTVVVLGGIASGFPGVARLAFAMGACTASFLWFFALGHGAAKLAPIFARPAAWRVLDALIGVAMWVIAGSLLVPVLR